MDQIYPDSSIYNVPFVARLGGRLDADALAEAFAKLVARHDILRTTFPVVDGEPCQQVDVADVPVTLTDLSSLAADAAETRCADLISAWADEPFNLANGPLMRVRLVRIGPDLHVLGVFLHHIVCDGLSMHVLFEDLAVLYNGGTLDPLPQQFADFTAWQAQQQDAGLDWWRDNLAGAPTTLDLPVDRARPAVRATEGAVHTFRLADPLVDNAITLARKSRVSPFMVMMAAYATLLSRLTGATELLIGTPVGGRTLPEHEPMIGYFVNTIPVRVSLAGEPTFAEVVRRVRNWLLDAMSHQQTPFESLVAAMRLDRDPSVTPLVQTMFTFELRPLAEPRFAGLTAEVGMAATATAKFDLDFMIVQAPDGSRDFDVTINYSTALFDRDTIERLGERYRQLLAAAVAAPDAPLWMLPVLLDGESACAKQEPVSLDATPVHELFELQAGRTPEAAAVWHEGVELSYRELDRRAEKLAQRLLRADLGVERTVGILLPRGFDLVVAVLGILKAGAAYLPLDPTHPAGLLSRVTRAAGVRTVVTADELAHRLSDVEAITTVTDDGTVRERQQGDLAYVIFTSGSTGEPKGVGVSHVALANHAHAVSHEYELSDQDRVLQFANIGFDVAAEEMFPTWLAGGCVVLCPDPVPPPPALSPLLRAGRVTVANLPASYWQQWAATDPTEPGLRLLVAGSEAVDLGTLNRWLARTRVPVVNAYGLSETTITSVLHRIEEPIAGPSVPIGRPLGGTHAWVLDEALEPVAPGVAGELYIGGAGLARGYVGRPDLTATRFIPNPFGSGDRLHRTGDRARWHEGLLEIIGRSDEQLKVRGYRIEPGQVEAAMSSHPAVTQAAVAARPGPNGDVRLVGYVVTASGIPEDLRAHLANRLPVYMVPSTFMRLAALPVSANGKVRRSALPTPVAAVATATAKPGSLLEGQLAGIWQDVLGLPEVGIHDNFFDLGGSSFSLAAVHSRLTDLIGRKLPMVTLYEHPTIAALARHLSNQEQKSTDTSDGGQTARVLAGRARLGDRRRLTR